MKKRSILLCFAQTACLLATSGCDNSTSGTLASSTNASKAHSSTTPKAFDSHVETLGGAHDYCVKLQPSIQSFVRVPLTLYQADDRSTDATHAADKSYIGCTYDNGGHRITLTLHDAADSLDDDKQNHFDPVTGVGDRAFSSGEKGGMLHWVDAVKGTIFCEALLGIEAEPLVVGEWAQSAGKMCSAAFNQR